MEAGLITNRKEATLQRSTIFMVSWRTSKINTRSSYGVCQSLPTAFHLRLWKRDFNTPHEKAKSQVPSCDVCCSNLSDADVTSLAAEWVPLTVGKEKPAVRRASIKSAAVCAGGTGPALSAGWHDPCLPEPPREFFPLLLRVIIFTIHWQLIS